MDSAERNYVCLPGLLGTRFGAHLVNDGRMLEL